MDPGATLKLWIRRLRSLDRRRLALAAAVALLPAGLILALLLRSPDAVVAPFPTVSEDVAELPALPPSALNVPVVLDLSPVLAALEREVPGRWGSMDERLRHPSNARISFAFELERGPFSARLVGDTARVSAMLRYRGRGWYDPPLAPEVSASCGTSTATDDRPRAVVAISSPLALTPDWRIQGRARVDRVAAASGAARDQCRVTFFEIDVTERVMNAAREQLARNTRVIDEAVAAIDLRDRFEEYWRIAREPIRLADDVWLVLNPTEVRHGPIQGQGLRLVAPVGLTAAPQIVLGRRPAVEPLPLPPLRQGSLEDGLHILADGIASYDAASRLLNRELRGRTLAWGGNRVELRQIAVMGIGGGRLAVEVRFGGTARGRVYLVGTPTIDEATQEIWVPDLDFDLATRHFLVSGAAWLVHGNLVTFLRERARIPVSELVELAHEQFEQGLNRELTDEVRLRGEVDAVEVLAVAAYRESMVVRSQARARARLEIGEEGAPLAGSP